MIYLDNAATSYRKPEEVYRAVEDCLRNTCVNPGRSGYKLALKANREVYSTRENLADFFHISDPFRIIFGSNATDALNLAIKGSLKPGDHVVTSSLEHNSVMRPLKALETSGVTHTVVTCSPKGELALGDLEAAIKENTRMMIITHGSNLIGSLLPIGEIGALCLRRGLLFLVDASQTAGVYEIDVDAMHIDMLALPGHKSIMGLPGTGMLYLSERTELRPLKEGGTGSKSEELSQPLMLPDRYESGTLNLPGIVSMDAGLRFIRDQGLSEIRGHEEELTKKFLEGILNIPGVTVYGMKDAKKQAPLVALNFENLDSSEAAYILDQEYDICIRAGIHCTPLAHQTIGTLERGAVRFSFGYFNTTEEINTAIEAVNQIAKK